MTDWYLSMVVSVTRAILAITYMMGADRKVHSTRDVAIWGRKKGK